MIFNVIKNVIFSYLVIYVGINVVKEFGVILVLGGVIGGIIFLMGVIEEFFIMNIFID